MTSPSTIYYRQLRSREAEIRRLKAELDDLKRILEVPPEGRVAFGLSRRQNIIFSLLMAREVATLDSIMQVLYGAAPNDIPDTSTPIVFLCNLRKRLPPWVAIKNEYGVGWYISRETKAHIREFLKTNGESNEPARPICASL